MAALKSHPVAEVGDVFSAVGICLPCAPVPSGLQEKKDEGVEGESTGYGENMAARGQAGGGAREQEHGENEQGEEGDGEVALGKDAPRKHGLYRRMRRSDGHGEGSGERDGNGAPRDDADSGDGGGAERDPEHLAEDEGSQKDVADLESPKEPEESGRREGVGERHLRDGGARDVEGDEQREEREARDAAANDEDEEQEKVRQ